MTVKELLELWLRRSHIVLSAHHQTAASLQRMHHLLGAPAIILSTLVGTTIFATLNESPNNLLKVGAGLCSVLAAVLTGLQTFLQFEERASRHRLAGIKYAVLMRELEQRIAFPAAPDADLERFVNDLRGRWDRLNEESPTIPQSIWREATS